MKKLNIFSIILAFTVLLAGCAKEISVKSLNELELSQTYVSIAPAGSTATVTITANTGWAVDTETIPEWLTLSATSGAAGSTTTVNISAPACEYGREAVLQIRADVHTQFLTVRQGNMVAEEVSCKAAMTGTAGKTYKVTGAVTKIVNTSYGNLYISDGSIAPEDGITENACYIYGTLDAKGAEKNFLSLGIEVGDVITVEGPLKYYDANTPELVNVTVSKIEKSLLKIDKDTFALPKEGGEFEVRAAYKGNGAYAEIAGDSFVQLVGSEYVPGIPSKLEKTPADTLIMKFSVSANEGGVRNASFIISSSQKTIEDSGAAKVSTTSMTVTVTQEGSATPINEVVVGQPCFVAGTITGFCAAGFIITDETGSILYYQSKFANPNNYVIGDKVEITCSKATAYNGALEVEPDNITNEVKVGHEDVIYPAPVLMGRAAVEEYLASCDGVTALCKYVKVCGKVSISGNYYNIIFGDSEKQGSFYQATDAQKALVENDKMYELTGYLIGYSKSKDVVKYANFLVLDAKELNPTKTFAEIIAAGAGNYSCEATVVAVGSNQVALTDGTEYMFMYNKAKNAAVGTKILLNGPVTQYNGCWEWNNPAFYVSVKDVPVVHPTAVDMTAAEFTAYQSAPGVKYYKVVGTKGSSGYDVTGDGFVINPYSNVTINPGSVTLYGYSIGINSNKMNFVVASVEQ